MGGLLALDTADAESEELKYGAHPLGVTLGEVVVDGHYVHAHAGKAIEKDGQGGNKRFSFTGLHLGDHAAVQGNASDELNVKVNHFPCDGLVTNLDGLAAESARGAFNGGKCLGHDLVEILRTSGIKEVFFDSTEGGLSCFNAFYIRLCRG